MVPAMKPILQKALPDDPWLEAAGRGLPGVRPLEGPWLKADDACHAQLELRDRLVAEKPDAVLAALPGSEAALAELRQLVAAEASHLPGYQLAGGTLIRSDGVKLGPDVPDIVFLGRACQEDFCLLEKQGGQHVLTAAALCFPASWKLSEKLGRPLTGIHVPVPEYDENVARRVQRLFDGLHVDRPIWRANALFYQDPTLHQPKKQKSGEDSVYFRTEFQVLRRLSGSRAIVFSIHTVVLDLARLTDRERSKLPVFENVSRGSR